MLPFAKHAGQRPSGRAAAVLLLSAVFTLAAPMVSLSLLPAAPPDVAPGSEPTPASTRLADQESRSDHPVDAAKPAADYTIHGTCYLWIENPRADPKQPFDKIPRPKTQVTLYAVHGPFDPAEKIAETTTDEHGRFKFIGLVPPRTELHFDRLAYGVVAKAEGHPVAIFPYFEHGNRDEMRVAINEKSFRLLGKVVDSAGKPVAGATVSYGDIWGQLIPGVLNGVTDAAGDIKIDDVAIPPAMFRRHGIGFRLRHPDFPPTTVSIESPESGAIFILPAGCTLTGQVVDETTGQPAAGVLVTAENDKSPTYEASALTDAAGRYRLAVVDGSYNVIAEAKDRACIALTDIDCQIGKQLELDPIKLTAGGWIKGQVVNPKTGEPAPNTDHGRVTVGLVGPSHPARKHILSPLALAEVDAEGRFAIRAAAGNNYPYLVNQRGDRMIWDTLKQPPVLVKEGQTSQVEIFITVEPTPEEKMKAARDVLAKLPEKGPERVTAILAELRKLNDSVEQPEVWCSLLRELVTIGPEAVPAICAELDQTDQQGTLRQIGFALRAIGDRRAVPALIRAIPKTLVPPSSDYGLLVDDAELTKFMQQNDLNARDRGAHFGYGRPVREILGTLHKLTGQDFGDEKIFSLMRSEGPHGAALQGQLYRQQAEKWQAWWEAHWRDFTQDEAFAKVNLPPEDPVAVKPLLTLGPESKLSGGLQGEVLSPAGEGGDKFIDLDTGLDPTWPKEIKQEPAAAEQGDLTLWAAQNGVDLMCVVYRSPDAKSTYALRALNMRVWEISLGDAGRVEAWVTSGKLPQMRPAGELLLHTDPKTGRYVPAENAAFLYMTREGSWGLIEVTDRVTEARDMTGQIGTQKGVDFHKGVRFNYQQILP